jgi:hypothetical protein
VHSDGGDAVTDEDPMVRTWFYTFGMDHMNPITGRSLRNNFVKLYGTEHETRDEMNARFGPRWAFQYPNADDVPCLEGIEKAWLYRGAGVTKLGLTELVLENVEKFRAPQDSAATLVHYMYYAACDQAKRGDSTTALRTAVTCETCKASEGYVVHYVEGGFSGDDPKCDRWNATDWRTGDPNNVTCSECKTLLADVKDDASNA